MSLNISEICDNLQVQDRRVKISTLELLQKKSLDNNTSDAEVLQIFDECYLYLLKCYSDRFESVRDQSIQTVSLIVERLPTNDFHFVNILSTLCERMGQEETVEDSEELRLGIMKQLFSINNKFLTSGNKSSLHECYKDIVRIALKALRDAYPAVQKEACSCIIAISASGDSYAFQPFAETLAKQLYPMLNHKHSQVRIAAVKTLGYLALHIDGNNDAISRLIMEVSPLLMDSMPLVRRECGELGVRLLLELRERYSYFERLIPLVLCCLKDDSPQVQEYILPLWEKCGKQYYDENEAELSKQEIVDFKAPNYPSNVMRPTIGCRGMVQRSLRILKIIMAESLDWKKNVRLHSLKLLYQLILHAEATLTAKFFEIYGDVAQALQDVDHSVVQEAVKVSDLMGRLLNYADWWEHGFEGFEKYAKLGYLKCFYYLYTASIDVKFEHNLRLSAILKQPEFSQTFSKNFQLYILKLVETILEKYASEKEQKPSIELYRNCYCSTIKVMSLCLQNEECEELQAKGYNILLKISNFYKCNINDLHEEFFIDALESVENIDASLEANSEPILLLYGLVKLVKFRAPYLQILEQKINVVFEKCADESKVKIFSAVSVAMLDWNETMQRPTTESSEFLKKFLLSVVEPHLTWKAGANAESMRSLATATLCASSQGAAEESILVLPYFAKYMPSLLEDQCVSTRHYSIKSLCNFGEIAIEYLKPIAYGCLQRLNDPSSGIRMIAAAVIPKLKLRKSSTNENDNSEVCSFENDAWLTFIKYCFNVLYLHYGYPDERMQDVIGDTINELSIQYPELSKESYERALADTADCYNLKKLGQQLPLI